MKATLLYPSKDQTGEGSLWLPNHELFLWVDIENKILHQYNTKTGQVKDVTCPNMISTLIPWKDDIILIGMQGSLSSYHLRTGELKEILPIEPNNILLRTNDGKASPDGRIFMGVMNMKNYEETGALYRIDPDLSIHCILKNQCIPNGIVWNSEGNKMYYADTGRGVIEEYNYNKKTGDIKFERIAIKVPQEMGGADGMTIDANNKLWVAHWGGFGVYVWNPETGELENKIEVPVPNVASCTFSENKLFITTARAGLSAKELEKYPLSGGLFVADISIKPGINNYKFKESNP